MASLRSIAAAGGSHAFMYMLQGQWRPLQTFQYQCKQQTNADKAQMESRHAQCKDFSVCETHISDESSLC